MNIRMVMSLVPDLAVESADDDGQLTLDLAADSPLRSSEPRLSRTRTEHDIARTAWASNRIDAAIDEMQDFLSVMHPTSDAEALQSLRLAFPTVPLTDRIAAIKSRFFV